jgi:hypothetical protein
MLFAPHGHNLSILMVRPIPLHGFNRARSSGAKAGGPRIEVRLASEQATIKRSPERNC